MSLYSQYFYSPTINELLSEQQTIAQMLRFEGALATAQSENGIIEPTIAEAIKICCQANLIDIERLKTDIKLGGNAAIPLVKQLTRIVKNNDAEASKFVHLGATSQDVIDTAQTLQIQAFISWIEEHLEQLKKRLLALSHEHTNTVMIGRTLLQHAKPITFGHKVARWLASIKQLQEQLQESKKRVLVLTLGGAVGIGNSYLSKGVIMSMATQLELAPPDEQSTVSIGGNIEFACILGQLVGVLGKIARDVSLLMQTEVAEVLEGAADGKGGSSTMPHKRNPVTCTAMLANAVRVPHLVATMLSAMPQEHERSAGLWHSQWEALADIMGLTAGSVERGIELIAGLEVDKERMLANLELTQGLIYAENISLALARKIGKEKAHELIEKACKSAIQQKKHLKQILIEMKLDIDNIDELFRPYQE